MRDLRGILEQGERATKVLREAINFLVEKSGRLKGGRDPDDDKDKKLEFLDRAIRFLRKMLDNIIQGR